MAGNKKTSDDKAKGAAAGASTGTTPDARQQKGTDGDEAKRKSGRQRGPDDPRYAQRQRQQEQNERPGGPNRQGS